MLKYAQSCSIHFCLPTILQIMFLFGRQWRLLLMCVCVLATFPHEKGFIWHTHAHISVDYYFYSWFNKWLYHDFHETVYISSVCISVHTHLLLLVKKVRIINKKRASFANWKMGRFERVCFQCMASKRDSARIRMQFLFARQTKINQSFFFPRHGSLLFFFIRLLLFAYSLFIWFVSFLMLLMLFFSHLTFATFIFPIYCTRFLQKYYVIIVLIR